MPKGIPYIIGNELAERFSFYGMKCILVVFMTKYIMDSQGNLTPLSNEEATVWYHWFTSAVYFTPLIGAIISDAFLGKPFNEKELTSIAKNLLLLKFSIDYFDIN